MSLFLSSSNIFMTKMEVLVSMQALYIQNRQQIEENGLLQFPSRVSLDDGGVTETAYNFTEQFPDRDHLCGLVVRVLGYRSGGLGSIPGTTRKKKCSGSGTGSTQPHEYN
jgi:hypothetical protein